MFLLAVLLIIGFISIDRYNEYTEGKYREAAVALVINTVSESQYPVEVHNVIVTKAESDADANRLKVVAELKETGMVSHEAYAPWFDDLSGAVLGKSLGHYWQITGLIFQIAKTDGQLVNYTSGDLYDSQYYRNTYTDWGKNQEKVKEQAEKYSDLKLKRVSVEHFGCDVWYRAKITNTGDKTYSFIRVEGVFYGASGNKVVTDKTIAVYSGNGLSLKPGKSETFTFEFNEDFEDEIDTYDIFITEVKLE